MRGRLYHQIPVTDVGAGDVIMYTDTGFYTRFVKSVSKKTVIVEQPKGMRPPTKRVSREVIKECWRRYKR